MNILPNKTISGRLERAVAEVTKIIGAIAATDNECQQAEAELAAARASLATAESETALGAVDSSVAAARRTHKAAQEKIETLAIRREGLEAKRTVAEDAMLELRADVDQARHETVTAKRAKWNAEYLRAAEALRTVLARGAAMFATTGEDSLAYRLAGANAADIDDMNRNLLDVAGGNILDAQLGNTVRFQSLQERDPAAAKEASMVEAELAPFMEFESVARQIITRRERAAADRQAVTA